MFFLSDAEISPGPLPVAVLDKRPLWMLLLIMLIITALLRFIAMDVVGCILSSLMLVMTSMMLANGMAEMLRYAVSFTALCVLCFFFDVVPLLASLTGRTEVKLEPGNQTHTGQETRIQYTTVIKTTPFFYAPAGFLYNVASLSMLLSPTAMLLAMYLGSRAHIEAQRSAMNLRQWAGEFFEGTPATNHARPDWEGGTDSGRARREADNHNHSAMGETLLRYHGRSHRLDES